MTKLALLLGFCQFTTLLAQSQQASDWNEKLQQMSFSRKPVGEYRVGAGDLLEIRVVGEDRLNQTVRLGPSGEINVPFVGSIAMSGLTQFEMEEKLRSELRRVLQNPQVTVFIREYRSKPVFVLGAVRNPGQYQITQRLNLVDAIAMAGGLDLVKAGEEVVVQRPPSESDPTVKPESRKVNLKDLLEQGKLDLNLPLEGGDIIQVPERIPQVFYVIGEVQRPGVFQMSPKQQIYLTQAIAQAGGPMKTAKTKKGVLVRFDENGGRQEVAVNFAEILQGRRADMLISPNDVVFIPGSTFKNIGYGLLGVIPSTVSGGIIYGTVY